MRKSLRMKEMKLVEVVKSDLFPEKAIKLEDGAFSRTIAIKSLKSQSSHANSDP